MSPALPEDSEPAPELIALLLELVPDDGTPVSNQVLAQRLAAEATRRLQIRIGPGDYDRCRRALVRAGMLRRSRDSGGSVARIVGAEADA